MNLIVVDSYDRLSREAAAVVAAQVVARPRTVLGLPTGRTPLGTYAELVKLCKSGELDLSGVVAFNLDEYYPLPPEHAASYHRYMHEHFFDQVNIAPENVHIPDGTAPDPAAECRRYEQAIRQAGGIDLIVLGIGSNGHIGFNEPGTPFGTGTHLVDLTHETRMANAPFFAHAGDVPCQAISMGIKSIMQARRIVLLASGGNKAEAVAQAFLGPVTEAVPASVLQLHPQVTAILERSAAARLVRDGKDLLQPVAGARR